MRARRSRVRRVAKWAGLIVCVLLLAVFALSGRYMISWRGKHGPFLALVCGGLYWYDGVAPYGWQVFRHGGRFAWALWPVANLPGNTAPLWVPFAIVALLTAFLWNHDRRIQPGHSRRCGYNLTGNVSGRCPECGAVR